MAAKHGFATMDPEKQRAIASKGGKAAQALGTGHRFTSDEARSAGLKGGAVAAGRPGYMAKLGRKGGAAVSKDREHMSAIGKLGGRRPKVPRG